MAKRKAPWISAISLHNIAMSIAPAVEIEEESRSFGWCSQVKLCVNVQLTGANTLWVLSCWQLETERKDTGKMIKRL